jgi:hypothetical protein
MPIILTCDCGKKLKVNEDKIGKKVKCPGCQAILSVPAPAAVEEPVPLPKSSDPAKQDASDEPAAPRKSKPKPAPVENDSDPEEKPTPKSKKKAADVPKKKSSSKLFLLLGLAAVLLFAVCGGGGLALYYFDFFKGFSGTTMVITPRKDEVKTDKGKGADAVIEPRAQFNANFGKDPDEKSIGLLFLSADGKFVAFNNGKATAAQMWDIAGEPKKVSELPGNLLALSPDANRAVLSKKGQSFLVDAKSGADIAQFNITGRPWFASNSVLWDFRANYNPSKEKSKQHEIISVSYDAMTGKKDKEFNTLNKGKKPPLMSEKGEAHLVSDAGVVHVWDPSADKWLREITLKPEAGERVFLETLYTLSTDGSWLLTNAGVNTFDPVAFDLSTGAGVKIPKQGMFPRTPAFVPKRDILMINKSGGIKKDQLAAYDLKTNAVVATFGTVEPSISSAAISSDGGILVAGSPEGKVFIWDLKKLP